MAAKAAFIRRCAAFAIIIGSASLCRAELPGGFVVFSKGNTGERTLYMKDMSAAGFSNERKICDKGDKGGDIQSQISFDGKWVAFSRSLGTGCGESGCDDYHNFGDWDVYIVNISGTLPAAPKKVGHGYWPSWSDDSRNATKTLYYSTSEDGGSIRAVTVHENGTLENDREIHDAAHGFAMCAPNGTFYAGRYSDGCVHAFHFAGEFAGQHFQIHGGCHPHITADSRWIIHANHSYGRYDGKDNGHANGYTPGLDGADYHYGSSPDMQWFVARTSGDWRAQNSGFSCHVFKMNAGENEFSVAMQQDGKFTDNGSWVDIHTFGDVTGAQNIHSHHRRANMLVSRSLDAQTVELVAVDGRVVYRGSLSRAVRQRGGLAPGLYMLRDAQRISAHAR